MATNGFNYDQAFTRNLGLVSSNEQRILRSSRAAIVGMGGMGGAHLLALARLGIGEFTVADFDRFEIVNFNRQVGASVHSLGLPKVEVMAQQARAINPEAEIKVMNEAIRGDNTTGFLEGADVLLDGLDFFHFEDRRSLFNAALDRGIPIVSSGPIGFSAILQVWTPDGMSFDEYFAIDDKMTHEQKLLAFAVGIAPGGTHLPYTDMNRVDLKGGAGPSLGLSVQMAAGLAAGQVAKLLLDRGPIHPVPYYLQFDAYTLKCKQGTLRGGNRHPVQRIKMWYVNRLLHRNAALPAQQQT